MNNFKRISAAALAAALMAGTTVIANADESKAFAKNGIVYYELDDGTLEAVAIIDKNLKDVVIPETVNGKTVTTLAWLESNDEINAIVSKNRVYDITSLSIPKSVTKVMSMSYVRAKTIKVDSQNKHFTSVDGVLFSKDKKILVTYPCGREEKNYTIPPEVTEIGNNAFTYSINLTNIDIPNSVTKIDKHAFVACEGLTNIEIPNSVSEINQAIFASCNNLKDIYLPKSISKISEEGLYIDSFRKFNIHYAGSETEWNKIKLITLEGETKEHSDIYSFMEEICAGNATMYYNSASSDNPITPAPQKTVYNSTTDVPGDIDGDGKPTAMDATALLKYIVGLADLEGNSMKNALLVGGEKPNAMDATQLLKIIAGIV